MEIVEEMATNPKVCKYLDMPLQHGADNMLKAMRRNITNSETRDLIKAIRTRIPDIALRTSLMVGYPGETEADFEEMVEFVKWARFERMGVFTYSHEENTRAHKAEDDVPDEVKHERAATLMEVQEAISLELNQLRVGKTYTVIIDRKEGGVLVGRTQYDSPEVDNEVLIKDFAPNIKHTGKMYSVKIVDAEEFDIWGEIVTEK
jgi:ribosomal protein S12 methylthiotransferase